MDLHDFYYDLPEELIAQDPLEKRRHIYKRSSSSRSQGTGSGTGKVSNSAVKLRNNVSRDKYLLIDGYNMIYALD